MNLLWKELIIYNLFLNELKCIKTCSIERAQDKGGSEDPLKTQEKALKTKKSTSESCPRWDSPQVSLISAFPTRKIRIFSNMPRVQWR